MNSKKDIHVWANAKVARLIIEAAIKVMAGGAPALPKPQPFPNDITKGKKAPLVKRPPADDKGEAA